MVDGKAQVRASTFRLECGISTTIAAPADRIWQLLTNADDFPRWNSTVTEIRGPIALGSKLSLKVPSSERTFTPRVSTFEPGRRMVWSDGMAPMFKGVRTFELQSTDEGTRFSMVEALWGLMLPMIKGSLPDFAPIFERYAADLKSEAESTS